MEPEKHNLYFIAIVPPEGICEEINRIKEDFVNRFESRKALKVVPHITLKAPFGFPAASHDQTLDWFEKMKVTVPPFQQELKDFGAFHKNRNPVIFVKPTLNVELENLQKQVLINFTTAYSSESIKESEFNPHITVAYRDLKKELFKVAWQQYQAKKYFSTFEVNSFQLLQHDGKAWNVISTFWLEQ
jgi:2'-5' RNA ligase